MTRLERLYDDVHTDCIDVHDYHFSYTKKAACMKFDDCATIVLDRAAIDSNAEEMTLLAEEYAHYETGALQMIEATYNAPNARINRIAEEGRAHRYAINKHIPFDEMTVIFDRCVYADGLDIYEFADKLDITPEFAKQAIEYYHQRGERW